MSIKNLFPSKKKDVLVKREEYHPLALLRDEINSLFDNFSRGFGMERFKERLDTFNPKIDIAESDKEIKISAELPGIDEKDIEVSTTKNSLTIRGEKKEEKEDKGKGCYRKERSYGAFSQTVQLPSEVDTDKIEANFKKGVLTVKLPKAAKAIKETKKIPVKAE